jgi:hypothetical protein
MKKAGRISMLAALAALLLVPASALAAKGGQHKAKQCAKVATVGYQVSGTLVSMTADDPATPESEATVTLTVHSANSHARNAGVIDDQNADRKGIQVRGATYTIAAGDAYVLKLGNGGAAVPSPGDRVKVKGRIARAKKHCAAGATAVPDVTRVTISDREPAVETETETETETS